MHAFLLIGGFEPGSLNRLLSSFLGSQSSIGSIFMVFFYIFLLSKGNSWNPIDIKLMPIWCWLSEDEVFAANSFSLWHSLVCSVTATHRRSPLISPPGSEFLLFFPVICNNLRYMKKTLSPYAFHFCSNSQQKCIKPSLLSHINSSLNTVCLHLRDTKMADSNRC